MQVHHALSKQLLQRLPALRAELALQAPLPRLQEHVQALVATFAVRPPLPFLEEGVLETLLLVCVLSAGRMRLPMVAQAENTATLNAFLDERGLTSDLLTCLTSVLAQQG